MCKPGDIILVKGYQDSGKIIDQHSFVVLSDEGGQIQGLDYELICNVMSSFKNEEQRKKKLSYPGNFEITHNDSVVETGNSKDGFIKAEQFYYFNKEKTNFMVIGKVNEETFDRLLDFISNLEINLIHVIDNL